MTHGPRRIVACVSKLHFTDAWYEVRELWHASTAHGSHHTAQHHTRDGALHALREKLSAHHGEPVELEVI